MRFLSLGRNAFALGLLLVGSASAATSAMSGELIHHIFHTSNVEAPVEPAPPNAGYYPTRWGRWDTEQAYLPGLRKAQGPPVTASQGEQLPEPKGSAAPTAPADKPKSEGDTAPRPPAAGPKPVEPAPLPGGGDLPPLPDAPNKIPELAPMPDKGVLPPPVQTAPAPGPDLLTPPPKVEAPMTQPKVERPREPEASPPTLELPPPQSPKEDKPPAPQFKEPELNLPQPKQPEVKQPETKLPIPPKSQEPTKEPADSLFEAPPRSGDKNQNKGASLPDRPSIRTTQATGQWVASGSPVQTEKSATQVAPVSDTEEEANPLAERGLKPSTSGQPARLPADEEAIPLSAGNQRPTAHGPSATPVGCATAKLMPLRDATVRGASWTEPVPEGTRPLPNPLRRQ